MGGRLDCVSGLVPPLPCRLLCGGGGGLVGLLFEICIVDASIFVASAVCPLIGGGRLCCFDVVETSYEGHMVDALASRADEGRWSLR